MVIYSLLLLGGHLVNEPPIPDNSTLTDAEMEIPNGDQRWNPENIEIDWDPGEAGQTPPIEPSSVTSEGGLGKPGLDWLMQFTRMMYPKENKENIGVPL